MSNLSSTAVFVASIALACHCRSSQSQQTRAEGESTERAGADPTEFRGAITRPPEATLDLGDDTLGKFDAAAAQILFQYLAGNSRWEIREERGLRFAIRKEAVGNSYPTTLNGYYSTNEGQVVHQTRVLLSFGKEHGFGDDYGNVTRARVGAGKTALIIEGDHAGTPGNSSYLIVDGGAVFLEIFDQAPALERKFTEAAFAEVCAELRDVLAHQEEIAAHSIMPVPSRYPVPRPTSAHFEVSDGMQPGIYMVRAAVRPKAPGAVFLKVFQVATGEPLSAERVAERSQRHVGWSAEGATLFDYGAEVTIYEGDWDHRYDARFELWHRSEAGQETKLAETTRSIHGWQR